MGSELLVRELRDRLKNLQSFVLGEGKEKRALDQQAVTGGIHEQDLPDHYKWSGRVRETVLAT